MTQRSVNIERMGHTTLKTVVDHETRETTVRIDLVDDLGGFVVEATGKAKWNPVDHFDPDIGVGIATGRALVKYGRKLTNYWKAQSGSEGEYRAQRRREQRLLQLGDITLAQIEHHEAIEKANRKPPKPVIIWYKSAHDDCAINKPHRHPDEYEDDKKIKQQVEQLVYTLSEEPIKPPPQKVDISITSTAKGAPV